MHVVKIEFCRKIGLDRPREEVKTAAVTEKSVALFDERRNGRIDEHVVKAVAAVQVLHILDGVFYRGSVDVHEFNAVFSRFFDGKKSSRPVKAGLVDIGNDHQRRFSVVMYAVIYATEPHRPYAR